VDARFSERAGKWGVGKKVRTAASWGIEVLGACFGVGEDHGGDQSPAENANDTGGREVRRMGERRTNRKGGSDIREMWRIKKYQWLWGLERTERHPLVRVEGIGTQGPGVLQEQTPKKSRGGDSEW